MDINLEDYEPEDEVIDGIYNDNNDDDDIGGDNAEDISVDDEIVANVPITLLDNVHREVEVTFAPPQIGNVTENFPFVSNKGASRQLGRNKGV